MVQWLRPHALRAGGAGSIPGQGTQILHASAKKKKNSKDDTFCIVYTLPQFNFF